MKKKWIARILFGVLVVRLVSFGLFCTGFIHFDFGNTGCFFQPLSVEAASENSEKFGAIYNVTKKEFGAKSGQDSTAAIQKALDKAAKTGTSKKRAQVYIPTGTYYISKTLVISSNTYLKCQKGVKIVKKTKTFLSMLRNAQNGKKGYKSIQNVTVDGGIWDGKFLKYNEESGGSLFSFSHGQNLEFKNLTIRNNYGTHLLELGGDKDVRITGCKFYGFQKSSNQADKEAIQLDVCHNAEILPGGAPFDDTPCQNILIENNEISDYPRAIGSHSLVKGIYPSDITISNNYIHDISQNAIYAYAYKNLKVTGNTLERVYAGIVFKSYAPEGGQTIFNRNKGVKAMSLPKKEYHVEIIGNTIQTTNYNVAKETMQLGIFVYGTEDYKIGKVTISDNTITSASTGIYMRYVDNSTVSGNTCTRSNRSSGGTFLVDAYKFLSCSNVTVSDNTISGKKNLYDNGIAFRENSKQNKVEGNTMGQVGKHGIGVYSNSSVTISDNSIQKAGEHGITVLDQSSATIANNTITESANNGITVLKASATIQNNTITKSGSNGMTILEATASVQNNTISESGQTGISIQNKAKVSSLKNNVITGNGKAIAINGATISKVTGNTMNSKTSNFVLTVTNAKTDVEAIRNLKVDPLSKETEVLNGTCQPDTAVYVMINGTRYDAAISKKTFELSIPSQVSGSKIKVTQEDRYKNKVIETVLVP